LAAEQNVVVKEHEVAAQVGELKYVASHVVVA
jgi:hypothetical protein